MEARFARIISYLFHPLLIPSYALLLLFVAPVYASFGIPFKLKMFMFFATLLLTFCFPVFFMYLLKIKGVIKSFQMESREERFIPFIITVIFFYSAFYIARQLQVSVFFNLFMLGAVVIILLALIINLWWKISIHMLAMGGFIGSVIGFSIQLNILPAFLLVILILLSGLVGFARLKINSHNQAQVYTGFLVGAFIMAGLFLSF